MRYRNKISIIALLLCMIVVIAVAENVKDGTGALTAVTTGDDNVAIGSYGLMSNTTGHGNTGLGAYAGRSSLTENGGVYLGYGAGVTNTSAHKLYLQTMFYPSYGIFGDFSTGYFGVNNTSPAIALDVTGAFRASTTVSGAGIYTSSNGTIAAPILYRATDTDTGLYWLASTGNRLGFTAKGVAVAIADSAGIMAIPALSVRMEKASDLTDSSLTVTLPSGVPTISLFGTDDDTYTISINTSDQAVFAGASGGYDLDDDVLAPTFILKEGGTQGTFDIDTSDAVNFTGATGGYTFDAPITANFKQKTYIIDADSTIGAGQTGTLFILRPLTAKRTITLPTAAANLIYEFMVADTDSLLIASASGDSLITSAGAAWKTTSSVAGTVKLVAIDTVRWIMQYTLGTWTSY